MLLILVGIMLNVIQFSISIIIFLLFDANDESKITKTPCGQESGQEQVQISEETKRWIQEKTDPGRA